MSSLGYAQRLAWKEDVGGTLGSEEIHFESERVEQLAKELAGDDDDTRSWEDDDDDDTKKKKEKEDGCHCSHGRWHQHRRRDSRFSRAQRDMDAPESRGKFTDEFGAVPVSFANCHTHGVVWIAKSRVHTIRSFL